MVRNDFNKKGQISAEYLIIMGFVLVALLPVFYYSLTNLNNNLRLNQANDMINRIAETADFVYFLGPGSQDTLSIVIPGGVESITLQGKEVAMKMRIFGSVSDFVAVTKATINGSISISQGTSNILIKNENNVIQITD